MPDVPNRDDLEKELARKLGRLNRVHMARLLELLGDPPDMLNVPPEFWEEAGEELAAVIRPFAADVYLAAAQRLLDDPTMGVIGVEWGLVNQRAAEWARQYSFDLVTGINDTSRAAIREAVENFFAQQQTIGELRKKLGEIYSPVRAEMIATTEVTRAAAQGELEFQNQLSALGVQTRQVWQTNIDERVCPICQPRHRKPQGEGWTDPPPAHVRCRCWLNLEFVQ